MSLLRDAKGLAGQVGRLKVGEVERKRVVGQKRGAPIGPTLKRSPWGLMTMGSLLTGAITRNCGVKTGFLG